MFPMMFHVFYCFNVNQVVIHSWMKFMNANFISSIMYGFINTTTKGVLVCQMIS
jgi:hypothetical protein